MSFSTVSSKTGFDPSKLSRGNITDNDKYSLKKAPILYDEKPILILTDEVETPFGISEYIDDKTKEKTHSIMIKPDTFEIMVLEELKKFVGESLAKSPELFNANSKSWKQAAFSGPTDLRFKFPHDKNDKYGWQANAKVYMPKEGNPGTLLVGKSRNDVVTSTDIAKRCYVRVTLSPHMYVMGDKAGFNCDCKAIRLISGPNTDHLKDMLFDDDEDNNNNNGGPPLKKAKEESEEEILAPMHDA